jgi:hypothetical protein
MCFFAKDICSIRVLYKQPNMLSHIPSPADGGTHPGSVKRSAGSEEECRPASRQIEMENV